MLQKYAKIMKNVVNLIPNWMLKRLPNLKTHNKSQSTSTSENRCEKRGLRTMGRRHGGRPKASRRRKKPRRCKRIQRRTCRRAPKHSRNAASAQCAARRSASCHSRGGAEHIAAAQPASDVTPRAPLSVAPPSGRSDPTAALFPSLIGAIP